MYKICASNVSCVGGEMVSGATGSEFLLLSPNTATVFLPHYAQCIFSKYILNYKEVLLF